MEDGAEPARAVGLTFGDFLTKMKDPAAADLVRNIKSFIRTFEERPASQPADSEADSAAVQAFLAQSEAAFRQHPVWRGCQPEVLDQAVEGLEKYVMSKVWRQTFGTCDEDRERDERYQRLMQALGFVDLPTLMGADVQPDETLLGMAQAELLKMDRYKAPRDKLLCLVNVKTMVENIVGLVAKAGADIGGADAFFPVFLFVLIRSRLPRLASNVEYVKRFRMHSRLSGQFDYMLCNLESGAMYLDTVNYEHLAVSQEAFLRHLAAAGIPEAHLELRRMQQEADQTAAEAEPVPTDSPAGAEAGAAGDLAADYGTPDRQRQGTAQQAQQAGGATDLGDVLAGLELASGGATPTSTPADGELSGLGSAQHSMPATPVDAAAAMFGGGTGSREGSLGGRRSTSLTPVPGEQSPTLLVLSNGNGGPGGASSTTEGTDEAAEQQQQGSGMMPRGLSFQSASELASVAEQQGQRQQQQQQHQAAGEHTAGVQAAAAAAAAAEQQHYAEAALIEEMVAEGTRHVLAAEAAGQLQQRYPFMYAQAEDLSLAEVQAVLVGYKELLLRYEALSRALQQQLGLGAGSPSVGAAAGVAEAGPWARSGSAHRSKEQQQGRGFGSVIPPGLDSALPGDGHQAGGAAPETAGPDASAAGSGNWSPGGLLQRISSRTMPVRSQATSKDQSSGRAGAQEAAAAAARVASPSKKSPHPVFSTLFGSSSPKRARAQQSSAVPSAPPHGEPQQQPQQAVPPSAASEATGTAGSAEPPAAEHPQPPQQQMAAAAGRAVSGTAVAEPSLDGEQEPAAGSAPLDGPAGSTASDEGQTEEAAAAEPAHESRPPTAAPVPAAGGSLLDAPVEPHQALQEAQPAGQAEVHAGAGLEQRAEQPGPEAGDSAGGGSTQQAGPAAIEEGRNEAMDDLLGLQPYGLGARAAAEAAEQPAGGGAEGCSNEDEQPARHTAAAEPLSLL